MSFLVNPTVAGLLDTQLNNVGYFIRGWWRVDGEKIGLPQAIPDKRKMDYLFRDVYMVYVSAYMTELTYRLVEQAYVVPNFIQTLQLNQLKSLYSGSGEHIPDFAKSMKIRNIQRELPALLRGHMLGSLVNSRSYYMVPDLLEQHADELRRKGVAPSKVLESRLWAHHLRRVLNPEQYLEKFLLGEKRITPEEGKLLSGHLKQMDDLVGLFKSAKDPIKPGEAFAMLKQLADQQGSAEAKRLLAKLNGKDEDMARVLKGTSWRNLMGDVRKHGLNNGIKEFNRFKALSSSPVISKIKQQPSEVAQKLFVEIKQYLEHAAVRPGNSTFLTRLRHLPSEKALVSAVQGPSVSEFFKNISKMGVTGAFKHYKSLTMLSSLDEVTAAVRQDVLLPIVKQSRGMESRVTRLFGDLSLSKVSMRKLHKVFEGSGFWLKLPISILSLFLVYGLLANTFDNKYLQPYQREIVKQRGDSTEFAKPGLLGGIPGILTFVGLMKLPFIQKLGYVSSFAVSGLAGLVVYAASTFAMFKQKLAMPRQDGKGSMPFALNPAVKPFQPAQNWPGFSGVSAVNPPSYPRS